MTTVRASGAEKPTCEKSAISPFANASAFFTGAKKSEAHGDASFGESSRRNENRKSADVMGRPSLQRAFPRSRNVQRKPSGENSQLSAIAGRGSSVRGS